jgi:phospholipid/cholesterol/gamma-HCH transport system substrate-binding protein
VGGDDVKHLDKASASAAVKLVIFVIVTTLATSLLVVTIGNLSFGDTTDYKAVFSDVTGLNEGDDVRIAGVRVGSVTDIEIADRENALVSFDVSSSAPLTSATLATIRYRNLVGQRYVALTEGTGGGRELAPGDTIPLEQTQPALDLTVLFNGFRPLFQALSPEDVNQLAYELIRVLQGEGGTIEALLARTSSLTNTLADRDRLIGDVIDNLNEVLVTLGSRDRELSQTILTLQQFATGLKNDRRAILGSLNSVSELTVETADLISDARPPLTEDIRQLRRLAATLKANGPVLDAGLQILPLKLDKIGHTATYGSWFNFYICHFRGNIILPKQLVDQLPPQVSEALGIQNGAIPIDYSTGSERCSL